MGVELKNSDHYSQLVGKSLSGCLNPDVLKSSFQGKIVEFYLSVELKSIVKKHDPHSLPDGTCAKAAGADCDLVGAC